MIYSKHFSFSLFDITPIYLSKSIFGFSWISKKESIFNPSSSFISIITTLYLSSFIYVFLSSFIFIEYFVFSTVKSICFDSSSSDLPIISVVVINAGKVDLESGCCNLQRNPMPFLPFLSI